MIEKIISKSHYWSDPKNFLSLQIPNNSIFGNNLKKFLKNLKKVLTIFGACDSI